MVGGNGGPRRGELAGPPSRLQAFAAALIRLGLRKPGGAHPAARVRILKSVLGRRTALAEKVAATAQVRAAQNGRRSAMSVRLVASTRANIGLVVAHTKTAIGPQVPEDLCDRSRISNRAGSVPGRKRGCHWIVRRLCYLPRGKMRCYWGTFAMRDVRIPEGNESQPAG